MRFGQTQIRNGRCVVSAQGGTAGQADRDGERLGNPGTAATAGECGLLAYRPATESYVFIRSDDLLSVEHLSISRRMRERGAR